MLRTIYQIGKSVGGDKTPWDDIVSNPVSQKDQEKRKYVMPINFDLDTGEADDLELMPLEEAFQCWKSGFFQHPHTVNGLLLYFRDRF